MKLTVQLRGYGNPDYAQYSDVAPKQTAEIGSLAEGVAACRAYIAHWDLGGGNWGTQSGVVKQDGKAIARVSYNGRVWGLDGAEVCAS